MGDENFGRIIRSINTFNTLGDFYADQKASTDAINELAKAGAISQAQYAEMFDGETISAQGREILENMLIGKAFESNPDAVREITAYKSIRQSIICALAEISNNLTLGKEYSLEDELAQAIALVYKARNEGYKAGDQVSGYARQGNLFQFDEGATVADYTNATVMMLADLLNENRVTRLKKTLSLYNHHAQDSAHGQMDLFSGSVESKQDIIKKVLSLLNNGTEAEQQQAIAEADTKRVESAREQQAETSEEVGTGIQQDGTAGNGNKGGVIQTKVDAERATALREALAAAYESGDVNAIQRAADDIKTFVDEGFDDDLGYEDGIEDYDGSDPAILARQYFTRVYHDRYLDDDEDQEYIKTGVKATNTKPSEQLKPVDLRDAVRPESAELGVNEANARAREAAGEPQPIGKGLFGNIYDQFKGKAKEAAAFLLGKRRGEASGVFHRDEIGDISLVYGNMREGLEHMIMRHIVQQNDFESVDELLKSIDDVISNGEFNNYGDNYVFEKDGYRAIVIKGEDGNWVLNAYDTTKPKGEKKRSEADATRLYQSIFEQGDGNLVPQDSAINGKGSEDLETVQGNEGENSLLDEEVPVPKRVTSALEEAVFKFLDDVFSNAKILRRARGRAMFVVVENPKTDQAAIIKLYPSEHGNYYNVESAGYYRKDKWKDSEDVIADLSEPNQSSAVPDASKPQVPVENGEELFNAEAQNSPSAGKVTKSLRIRQGRDWEFIQYRKETVWNDTRHP